MKSLKIKREGKKKKKSAKQFQDLKVSKKSDRIFFNYCILSEHVQVDFSLELLETYKQCYPFERNKPLIVL